MLKLYLKQKHFNSSSTFFFVIEEMHFTQSGKNNNNKWATVIFHNKQDIFDICYLHRKNNNIKWWDLLKLSQTWQITCINWQHWNKHQAHQCRPDGNFHTFCWLRPSCHLQLCHPHSRVQNRKKMLTSILTNGFEVITLWEKLCFVLFFLLYFILFFMCCQCVSCHQSRFWQGTTFRNNTDYRKA